MRKSNFLHMFEMLVALGINVRTPEENIELSEFFDLAQGNEPDPSKEVLIINDFSALERRIMGMHYDTIIMDDLPWAMKQAKRNREEWKPPHRVYIDPKVSELKRCIKSKSLRKQQRLNRKQGR